MRPLYITCLFFALFSAGCYHVEDTIEPHIASPKDPRESFLYFTRSTTPPFEPLSSLEQQEPWGQELTIGYALAAQFDLYRAITAFKRAKILSHGKRILEIDYAITLSYYLGKKYAESLQVIEQSPLARIDSSFPLYDDLLKILYENYTQLHMRAKAAYVLQLIQNRQPNTADSLALWSAVTEGDLETLSQKSTDQPFLQNILHQYDEQKKSVTLAQYLNCIPGAGYWYLGMHRTALTALIVNSLFIGATYTCFTHHNIPAGIFTASLESGWYLGGIYGAGLAAKRFNEKLYEKYAYKISEKERFFPLFMIEYQF